MGHWKGLHHGLLARGHAIFHWKLVPAFELGTQSEDMRLMLVKMVLSPDKEDSTPFTHALLVMKDSLSV